MTAPSTRLVETDCAGSNDDVDNISLLCGFNWESSVIIYENFLEKWQQETDNDTGDNDYTRDIIVVSVIGSSEIERKTLLNCLFHYNLATDQAVMNNIRPFMRYFEDKRSNHMCSLEQSIVVIEYAIDYPLRKSQISSKEVVHAADLVKFSYNLSTVVIFCYDFSNKWWTNSLGTIWDKYIDELSQKSQDITNAPILIIIEMCSSADILISNADAKAQFCRRNHSIFKHLSEYFADTYVLRLSKNVNVNQQNIYDFQQENSKQLLECVYSQENLRTFSRHIWLNAFKNLISEEPIDNVEIQDELINRISSKEHIKRLVTRSENFFLYLYRRSSILSVNWFCHCHSMAMNFLSYTLAAQLTSEKIKPDKENISQIVKSILNPLFRALFGLKPCNAIYKGVGYAKDNSTVYCYRPKQSHSKHRTSKRVYGTSVFSKLMNRSVFAYWKGDFDSCANCNEKPTEKDENDVTALTRNYMVHFFTFENDPSHLLREVVKFLCSSNIDLTDREFNVQDHKSRSYCICCIHNNIREEMVNVYGVCHPCKVKLVEYSQNLEVLPIPIAYTGYDAAPNYCVICVINERNYCLLPCGHRAYCKTCADRMINTFKRCAICFDQVNEYMRTIKIDA